MTAAGCRAGRIEAEASFKTERFAFAGFAGEKRPRRVEPAGGLQGGKRVFQDDILSVTGNPVIL
jgi:hypothetical protein